MKKILLVLFILLSFPLGVFALTANAATSEADELGTVELVSVTSVNSTSVMLTWRDDSFSYQQNGYKIYRATSKSGEYSEIANMGRYTTSYTDYNLTMGKKYYYKICKYTGFFDSQNGPFSNIKSGKAVPQKMYFNAVSHEANAVTLTWNEAAESSVDGYNIYRSSSPDGEFEFIKKIKKRTTTSYTDKTAKYGKFYYYKMRAYSVVDDETVYGTKSDPVRSKVDISQCRAYFVKVGQISADSSEFYGLLRLKYGDKLYTVSNDFGIGSYYQWISNGRLTQLKFNGYGYGTDLTGSSEFTIRPISQKAYISDVSITNSGVQVTWQKESGAVGYKIYRKTGSSSYGKVKTISDNEITSWTDTDAKKTNTKYSYFVKAYTKDNGESQHTDRSDIKSVTRIDTPKPDDAVNVKQGIVFTWKSVKGAKSYDVLRKSGSGSWEFIANTKDTQYTDTGVTVGKRYTYTVCCSDEEGKKRVSRYDSSGIEVTRCIAAEGKSLGSDSVKITWNKAKNADGYAVYRATSQTGTYKKIKTISDPGTLSYTDKKLTFGKYYYYKIRPYTVKNDKKVYGEYGTVAKIRPTIATVSIKKAEAESPTTVKLTWKTVEGADAYQIYQASYENGTYTKVKTVKGGQTTSYTVDGLENGNTYYFKIRGYKEKKGEKYYGSYSSVKSCYIDMLGYADESYYSKNNRIWGSNEYIGFETSAEASKAMKTIKVKTWDIDSKGKKYTRYHYVTVHKNLAPTVEAIFKEIYNGKEKFPIKSVGGYAWRGNGLSSQHGAGLALDINPNENAQFNGATGKPMVGSHWKPGEDPYSIPADGDVVRAFEKYGFGWGNWFDNPDYMHFSYYGI